MSDEQDQQIIRDMAKLTMMNNRVSDVQIMNLKMYAMAFFNGVSSARIEYDVSTQRDAEVEIDKASMDIKYAIRRKKTSKSKVIFWLSLKEGSVNADLPYRFAILEKSVRNLFWSDLSVEVNFNEEQVFKSSSNV